MKIESQKLNITETFRNYYYTVPDYQREYIWEQSNVNLLLADIYDEFISDPNSEYFIGSVVVNRLGDGNYEVIDGQQRLTTLFLGLCVFKKFFKEMPDYLNSVQSLLLSGGTVNERGEIINKSHLILQYEDSTDLLDKIVEEKDIRITMNGSSAKIKNAYDEIRNFLNTNFTDKKEIAKFYGYYTNKVNFIQIETPNINDALKTFETINERGIGLNPMDLLKNLIFRQLDRDKFKEINLEWKKMSELLSKNKQKSLRFLRYFIMSNYKVKDTKDTEVVREDEIYTWISRHDEQCNYSSDPFGFVKKLIENTEAYVNFQKGLNIDNTSNNYLNNIRKLGGGSFSQHLVLLLSAKDLNKELFTYLVRQIETLVFYYTITKTPAKKLEVKFSKWANELRLIVLSADNKDEALNDFINDKFQNEIKGMSNDYKINFENLNINSLQNYKIKYTFAKIAQYIDSKRLGQKEPGSLDNYLEKEKEIEHILPNNPEKDLIEEIGDQEEYDELKIKFGNLTLLEKPINIVAGRNFFSDKKELYKDSNIYLTKSIVRKEEIGKDTSITRINKKLLSFDKWDKESIKKRQEMLYKLSMDIWKVESFKNLNL